MAYTPDDINIPTLSVPSTAVTTTSTHLTQTLPNIDASSSPRLEHPKWRAILNRIPKAARVKCETAFSDILIKTANDPTSLESWTVLFSFGPTILAKLPRGGANRNLANVVLKRLTGCSDNQLAVPDVKSKKARTNTHGHGHSSLAAPVRNKLEAGNMRAAVRLLCSDDVQATTHAETLKALRSKHPPTPTDRRATCSYTGNLQFQPLQVSSDDLIKSLGRRKDARTLSLHLSLVRL